MRWWAEECFDELDVADPLQDERMAPLTEDEAARIEELCLAASPGRLVVDDQSEGGGGLVATLPDGRAIVSERPEVLGEDAAAEVVEANAQLICRARCMLLRMLHDRRRLREREEELLARIAELESKLKEGGYPPSQPR